MNPFLLILAAFAVILACQAAVGQTTRPRPAADRMLDTLDRSHPRLILKDRQLAELKALIEKDPLARKCRDDVLAKADALCAVGPVVYKVVGPRLLAVSQETLRRSYTLGLAWRLTGKQIYADKARENLLAACEFKDWNPSHFLDTAEMSHAVGLGLDWFWPALDGPTREKLRAGLIEKGLKPGLAEYQRGWWPKVDFNWNQVCNGGLLIGALAVADSDPEIARQIVSSAVASLPRALATYGPDGAWPEGPGYWNYATRYTVYALAALESALGTDFGLSSTPGLDQAGGFPLLTSGPTGFFFNFADDGEASRRGLLPPLFWLGRRYANPALAKAERAMLAGAKADPLDLIWFVSAGAGEKLADPPLDKLFRGSVELAVFCSRWHDPAALFVAVKAGYNQVNHGHLDLGNFVIDALGVRWARDLGSDDYNLPDYWGKSKAATRWTYYRLGSLSHNVPVLDGQNQDVMAKTKFAQFKSGADGGRVTLDLSSAYAGLARSVNRGVAVIDGRRAVLVQDEFEIDPGKPADVAWGLTTDAEVAADGKTAVLTLGGKKCTATLLSPADGQFAVESAEQKPPQKPNTGVRRLTVRLAEQSGSLRIAVLLRPNWPNDQPGQPPKLEPLSRW